VKKYRVVVESMFVRLPDEENRGLYGYFATFEAMGSDAKQAMRGVLPQLSQRISSNGLHIIDAGIYRTRYVVDNVWEVVESDDFVGGGFTFFRIRPLNAIASIVRYAFIRAFRPYLIFDFDQNKVG